MNKSRSIVQPCSKAIIATVPGKVLIRTDDGRSICLTPKAARSIARGLLEMADEADESPFKPCLADYLFGNNNSNNTNQEKL